MRYSSVTGKLHAVWRAAATARHSDASSSSGVRDEDSNSSGQSGQLVALADASLSLTDYKSGAAVAAVTASERLAQRTFSGLQPQYGQTPVAVIEDGLSGIARGYESERQQK